jgi:hypothetical protein
MKKKPAHVLFVDTDKKAKERLAQRQRIRELQEEESKQIKIEEAMRAKNRKIGQLSLTETTLSQFTKKKGKNREWW